MIKEILVKLKDDNWYDELDLTGDKWIELKQTETKQLLDYITNLQEKYNDLLEVHKIENNDIQELLDRIDKAIEYIKENEFKASDGEVCYICNMQVIKDLLNILKGE